MRYCCSLGLRGILLFSFLLGFKLKNSLSILLSSRDVSSLLHFSQWAWILFDLVILHWGVGFKQSRNSKNKSPETPTAKQKNKKKRTQPEKTQKGRELKTTFKCFFFRYFVAVKSVFSAKVCLLVVCWSFFSGSLVFRDGFTDRSWFFSFVLIVALTVVSSDYCYCYCSVPFLCDCFCFCFCFLYLSPPNFHTSGVLNSMWQYAAVLQFLRCFKSQLGLKGLSKAQVINIFSLWYLFFLSFKFLTPSHQSMEQELLNPDASVLFHEIHVKLLRGLRKKSPAQHLITYPFLLFPSSLFFSFFFSFFFFSFLCSFSSDHFSS